jgi:hypothetical protein
LLTEKEKSIFVQTNKNTMKKLLSICLVASALLLTASAFSQSTNVSGRKFNANGVGAKLNLPTADVVAPKPDPKRGTCCLNFDNWTGYTLYVWVDGQYRGTVNAWDEGSVCVYSGWTSYYVRTAGSTYEWDGSGECTGDFNLTID